MFLPYSDCKASINRYAIQQWQEHWNTQVNNKLFQINSRVNKCQLQMKNLHDDMVIRRARIGHTFLTHGYLLRGELPPECNTCLERITVKHILIDCNNLHNVRRRFYSANTLKDLFDKVSCERIIAFLKEVQFYNKF